MTVTWAIVVGLIGAMEVSNQPVAIVVKYPDMTQISLAPEDVMIYSEDIPQVQTVANPGVVYSQRSMAEMVAANIPEPPPESKPTLPNESRQKKRLDHTPPFNGTVTGEVSIVKTGPNERMIVVSNIQGDGIMQVLIKGGTAKNARGADARPVLTTPKVLVRNSKSATSVAIGGVATEKSLPALDVTQRSSLESHFQGKLPADIKVVSEAVTVK